MDGYNLNLFDDYDSEQEATLFDFIEDGDFPSTSRKSSTEDQFPDPTGTAASDERYHMDVDEDDEYIEIDDDDDEEDELEIDDELRKLAKEMAHISEQDLTALMAYNESYLEIVDSLITKTDQALNENRDALEEIHEKLSNKSEMTKPYMLPLLLYGKPYFKDRYGMPPPINSETEELYRSHQLITFLKEDHYWKDFELKNLQKGIREQLIRQMNLRLESRKSLLEDKIYNFDSLNTDDEVQLWKEEIASLERKILFNENLPNDEVFRGDYSNISWTEVSVKYMNGKRSATACQMKWLNEQRPEINKSPWTEEEEEKLKEVSLLALNNWNFIAQELGTNRTEFQCFCRIKELELKLFNEKTFWTHEDDEKLTSIVYGYNNLESIPWHKVAKLMGNGRMAAACRKRFNYSLQLSIRMGRWSYAEDMFLLDAVNRYGPFEWERIASCVPGRSAPQCRCRYSNVLSMSRNVQKFTTEEDEMILKVTQILGRGKWSEISQLLPNRLPNDVRSRYRQFLNRKFRKLPPYEAADNRNVLWSQFTRRQESLTRFQIYEATEALKSESYVSKRFGIGEYVVNKLGEIRRDEKVFDGKNSKFGNFHIYYSGVFKRPLQSIEEFRAQRFERLYNSISPDVRERLDSFLNEMAERKRSREIEYEMVADEGGMQDELEKRYFDEDVERIKALIDEMEVTQSDRDQFERRKLPRYSVRRAYRNDKHRARRVKPYQLKKLAKTKTKNADCLKYEIVREMCLTPEIAQVLQLPFEKIYRLDGTRRRISQLVLMNDGDSTYWATERDVQIMKFIYNLNQHLVTKSMFEYHRNWRLNSVNRSMHLFRNELTFNEVPAVYEPPNKETFPPLEAFAELISNVLMPCRGTLTAMDLYTVFGRELCTSRASQYFDPLDENGYPQDYLTFTHQRLDIELPSSVTNSVDYLLLRSRIFKMFFLPMLLQYGQMSREAQNQIREQISRQQLRRTRERISAETSDRGWFFG